MVHLVLPLWVPLVLLAEGLGLALLTVLRLRDLRRLPSPGEIGSTPGICLCIPARNEGHEIGRALDSWLAQDYPDLRIVVVDDGSTDGTSEQLARRARLHPERLCVLRNEHLPPGWLGKNHALHLASSTPEARAAEWLLFADADVQAAPDLLQRVMALQGKAPADILALLPTVEAVSPGERLLLPTAVTCFLWLVPPSRVGDPKSAFYCGTGAFTLLRRKVYDCLGGHAAAPMEPIDDMMLARRAKRAGFLNRVVQGGPDLHLRMYPGAWAVIRAMRKNILGLPWLWAFTPLMMAGVLLIFLCPLWLAVLGRPGFAALEWLLWPLIVGLTHRRLGGKGFDWIWLLWPLIGPAACVGIGWAFWDRLRGVNHWRGRSVAIRG